MGDTLLGYLQQQNTQRRPSPAPAPKKASIPPSANFSVPKAKAAKGGFSQGGPITEPPAPKSSGGGGFFHAIGSVGGDIVHEAGNTAAYIHNKTD